MSDSTDLMQSGKGSFEWEMTGDNALGGLSADTFDGYAVNMMISTDYDEMLGGMSCIESLDGSESFTADDDGKNVLACASFLSGANVDYDEEDYDEEAHDEDWMEENCDDEAEGMVVVYTYAQMNAFMGDGWPTDLSPDNDELMDEDEDEDEDEMEDNDDLVGNAGFTCCQMFAKIGCMWLQPIEELALMDSSTMLRRYNKGDMVHSHQADVTMEMEVVSWVPVITLTAAWVHSSEAIELMGAAALAASAAGIVAASLV